jgi:mannose-6-phosphate isomerase
MEVVKLRPYIKEIVWGGNTLRSYGKVSDTKNIAECWELSLHKEGSSIIDSGELKGKTLADVLTKEDCGEKCEKFPFFPTLIKLIDADRELSVQVHPSDEYALKNENSFGKTEMWYILETKKDAGIYLGFKRDTTKEEVERKIKDNTLVDLLNFIKVKPGDCYFVKSGTVHAIGGGITLFEVQQNSALTYRLYDWGKLGMDGKPRELHIDKSLKVMNFKKFKPEEFKRPLLGECDYFSTFEMKVDGTSEINANKGSFISITFIEGNGLVNNISYAKGDTFFIPDGKKAEIKGNGKYLLTTIK